MASLTRGLGAWGVRSTARILRRRYGLEIAVSGLEHVPRRGAVVLAARHYHHAYDGVALIEAIPRELHILVALDWARGRWERLVMERATRFARWPVFLRGEALVPGRDGSPPPQQGSAYSAFEVQRYRRRGLEEAVALLDEGGALVVFPEGYPNIDPRYTPKTQPSQMLPFRPGFLNIVAISEKRQGGKIPIVPVGLSYGNTKRPTVRVTVGQPRYLVPTDNRKAVSVALEREVALLSRLAPLPLNRA